MKEEQQFLNYRFTCQHKAKFGEGLFVSGSIKELGNWNPKEAIKMIYEENYGWSVQVKLPLGIEFQYKYFVGSFQVKQPHTWLGNHNKKLKICQTLALSSDQKNKKLLRIMSFNVRFQTEKDKKQCSWANRKDNCVQVIINNFPDLIGVQEPRQSQRVYLSEKIGEYYDYYGKPRDLKVDENSGIFIRKDKYHVIEDGYIWINENKAQGKLGFGAYCIRYFTYLLVAPYCKNQSWFLVFNTHLDHQVHKSRLNGIKYMTETIENMNKKYNNNIKDIFVMGDFNTSDDDQIFKHLTYNNEVLRSMRYALPQKDSDLGATFNGFTKMLKLIDKTMKFFNLNPGATIDHIFFRSEHYKPVSFKTIQVQGKIVSDHYPIVGIFESTS